MVNQKSSHLTHYLTVKDHLVSDEEFSLLYDHERQMLITDPQPGVDDLASYYDSKSYISHTDSKQGFISFLYQSVKKRALKKKTALIFNLHKGTGSILEIGAGTGEFLLAAKNKGWEVSGVEPNNRARNLAKAKGLKLEEDLNDLREMTFDVITLWHVLEHLPNLEETIEKMERLLKPNGILIVAAPNYKSFDAKYYHIDWAAYDVPRHLWHFSKSTMKQLFSKNIRLEKIKPMIFDSFYVSLLSEKYKKRNLPYLRALFIGLRSNISAWTSQEYSSLIYCYRKTEETH